MATIITAKGKGYLFTFSPPETEWIRDLANSMGITKEAVLGAAMNKGLTHYVEVFCKAEVVDKLKDQIEGEIFNGSSHAKDHKEFHKGSCQG